MFKISAEEKRMILKRRKKHKSQGGLENEEIGKKAIRYINVLEESEEFNFFEEVLEDMDGNPDAYSKEDKIAVAMVVAVQFELSDILDSLAAGKSRRFSRPSKITIKPDYS